MDLTVVTVVFLVVAVLVAIGVLVAVAVPNLRHRDDHDDGTVASGNDQRHSSRTRREP